MTDRGTTVRLRLRTRYVHEWNEAFVRHWVLEHARHFKFPIYWGKTGADQINQLTSQNVALTDTVGQLKTQNNTVYYIIGTRDELMQRGIIVQEGGSRFPLIFAKLGQVLMPARQIDPKDFTPINKRVVTEIPLPAPDKAYRIASRQNLEGLATPPGDGGQISGSVKIANPDRFWSGSRFLILVQS